MFQNFVNLKTDSIFISTKCHFIYAIKMELESNQVIRITDFITYRIK